MHIGGVDDYEDTISYQGCSFFEESNWNERFVTVAESPKTEKMANAFFEGTGKHQTTLCTDVVGAKVHGEAKLEIEFGGKEPSKFTGSIGGGIQDKQNSVDVKASYDSNGRTKIDATVKGEYDTDLKHSK